MTRCALTATGVALALLALLGAAPAFATGSSEVEDRLLDLQLIPLEGQSPPPFTLDGLDGERASLSDFRGQVVLLYFWASW